MNIFDRFSNQDLPMRFPSLEESVGIEPSYVSPSFNELEKPKFLKDLVPRLSELSAPELIKELSKGFSCKPSEITAIHSRNIFLEGHLEKCLCFIFSSKRLNSKNFLRQDIFHESSKHSLSRFTPINNYNINYLDRNLHNQVRFYIDLNSLSVFESAFPECFKICRQN